MIPTTASSNAVQTMSSAMMGIASVILEGRAVSDDDFVLPEQPYNRIHHFQRLKEKLGQLKQTPPSTSHDIFSSPRISISNSSMDEKFYLGYKQEDIQNNIRNQNKLHEELSWDDKPLLSLQSLVTTTLCSTPRSVFDTRFWGNSKQNTDLETMSPESMLFEKSYNINDLKATILTKTAPRQGPHCEQFLKKIGIFKNIDYEEHICDTSIVNEIVRKLIKLNS